MLFGRAYAVLKARFSALQRAENFSMTYARVIARMYITVSVLFSEPKISQLSAAVPRRRSRPRFSALQRAENFSISRPPARRRRRQGFSALQRAENFSIQDVVLVHYPPEGFSALQRAENFSMLPDSLEGAAVVSFSALQRAENFSIVEYCGLRVDAARVSVLFSEPKISQFGALEQVAVGALVSVLFSEPKISQFQIVTLAARDVQSFSALQRAENFSILISRALLVRGSSFSALQRAENFSIRFGRGSRECVRTVSVLFSEPKISQSWFSSSF